MPTEFGACFEALLEGLITEAAKRGEVDLSLVSIDPTTARAHHDAAGTRQPRRRSLYDKTPDSYLAGLHLRASMIWIKDLTRTTR